MCCANAISTAFGALSVVGVAANAEELFTRLDEWLPDVVVMDLLMPGGMDGGEATRRVRTGWPRTQAVIYALKQGLISLDELKL